ncbi:tetratricopeptide repeat protein [Marinoscillum sp. 108]|uniref:tetratricopeptide repeat protein n=1 Tax=Marinoscillum sp. 108 TaxID=2653151 RepID=UPI001C888EFE|nr:hypothetical protein [Marinoscillum sp. 108]
MGLESCKCLNTINADGDSEQTWEKFNTTCWSRIIEQFKDDINALEFDTTDTEIAEVPEYKRGYELGKIVGVRVFTNMIDNCDEFYEIFKKMIPKVIDPNTVPIYGEGEIDSLTNHIELGINLFDNYCDRAIAYYKKSKTKKAISDLDKAIELKPDQPTPHIYKGIIHRNNKKYCSAAKEFETAYQLGSNPMILIFSRILIRECGN